MDALNRRFLNVVEHAWVTYNMECEQARCRFLQKVRSYVIEMRERGSFHDYARACGAISRIDRELCEEGSLRLAQMNTLVRMFSRQ